MADKDVELRIGADGSQASSEFDKVASAADKAGQRIHQTMREASYNMAASTKAATEQMQGSFAKVADSFKSVNVMLAGFTAIIAGGAAFKAGIDESVKLTTEANKLGKQLGITATEASVLNVALGDVYVDTDTMLAANQRLTKTLGSNEQAFKNLGVATRDANGNFRSSLDIMLDVNSHLMKFKEGVDRNIEGQKIYGKQWGEVQGILKLTTDRMEEARAKAEALGLVVGKENVEAAAAYKAAMNDVGDVLSALKKSVGDALLPILTDLGNWFASVGPEAAIAMKGAIGGVAAVFYGLKMAVEIAYEVIRLFVLTSVNVLMAYADAMSKALTFDMAGARAAWKNGANALADDFGESMDRIVAKAEANRERLAGLFVKPTATTKKEGGDRSEGAAEKSGNVSQVNEWKAELQARKEVEGAFFKSSLADDEAFWQSKLAHVKTGSKDEIAIRRELFALHKTMAQQKFNDEQEALKTSIAAARVGSAERITLATDSARRVGETYGWESKEYMAAIREIKKLAEDFEKEQQKLDVMKVERARDHSTAMIGMERDRLAFMRNLGQVSESEEIAALRSLDEQEYQIALKAQQDKIALMKEEGTARQQQLDELAKMQDKHDAAMARSEQQRVMAVKKQWETALGAVNGAFEQSINGMIMGTQTMQKAMANISQAIVAEFVKLGVKRVTTWVANEAAMTTASKTKDAVVATSSAATTTVAIGAKATEATAVVSGSAAEGAAGAAASQAAIPVIGPGLAVAAFASMMGMVLGAKSLIKSSAGGEWKVDEDRLNLVHKDETILPAHIAKPLREMVEGGGGDQDGVSSNTTINNHLSPLGGMTQSANSVTTLISSLVSSMSSIGGPVSNAAKSSDVNSASSNTAINKMASTVTELGDSVNTVAQAGDVNSKSVANATSVMANTTTDLSSSVNTVEQNTTSQNSASSNSAKYGNTNSNRNAIDTANTSTEVTGNVVTSTLSQMASSLSKAETANSITQGDSSNTAINKMASTVTELGSSVNTVAQAGDMYSKTVANATIAMANTTTMLSSSVNTAEQNTTSQNSATSNSSTATTNTANNQTATDTTNSTGTVTHAGAGIGNSVSNVSNLLNGIITSLSGGASTINNSTRTTGGTSAASEVLHAMTNMGGTVSNNASSSASKTSSSSTSTTSTGIATVSSAISNSVSNVNSTLSKIVSSLSGNGSAVNNLAQSNTVGNVQTSAVNTTIRQVLSTMTSMGGKVGDIARGGDVNSNSVNSVNATLNNLMPAMKMGYALPASLAGVARMGSVTLPQTPTAPASGGNDGTGGGDVAVHIHSVVSDTNAVKRFLLDNNGAVAAAMRKHIRDGGRL